MLRRRRYEKRTEQIFCARSENGPKIDPHVSNLRFYWFRFRGVHQVHPFKAHTKTLFEMPMALSLNSGSFPSNSNVSATFSFWIHSRKFWNPANCEKFNADGRWWEGRILINLCGKKNVRNCDLLHSDFFARCRTVLGWQRVFLACVVKLGKRWGPETLWFFTLRKHATKSHLPKLVFRAGRSDISGPERVSVQSTAAWEMKFIGVSSTYQILKFIFSDGQPFPIVPQNAATAPAINRLRLLSVWQPPPNCWRFHDNLYHALLSGCSALPESRRQSLPHPYSPLRDSWWWWLLLLLSKAV